MFKWFQRPSSNSFVLLIRRNVESKWITDNNSKNMFMSVSLWQRNLRINWRKLNFFIAILGTNYFTSIDFCLVRFFKSKITIKFDIWPVYHVGRTQFALQFAWNAQHRTKKLLIVFTVDLCPWLGLIALLGMVLWGRLSLQICLFRPVVSVIYVVFLWDFRPRKCILKNAVGSKSVINVTKDFPLKTSWFH